MSPRPVRGQKVERICACGRTFWPRKADVDRGWGVYCSKSCKANYGAQPAPMRLISWRGRTDSGIDVPVSPVVSDAINLIARHIAASHFELEAARTGIYASNVSGIGAAAAHHLHSTDPKLWERFKGDAVFLIRCLYGSGEKGIAVDPGHEWVRDGMSYFRELGEFAGRLRGS